MTELRLQDLISISLCRLAMTHFFTFLHHLSNHHSRCFHLQHLNTNHSNQTTLLLLSWVILHLKRIAKTELELRGFELAPQIITEQSKQP